MVIVLGEGEFSNFLGKETYESVEALANAMKKYAKDEGFVFHRHIETVKGRQDIRYHCQRNGNKFRLRDIVKMEAAEPAQVN